LKSITASVSLIVPSAWPAASNWSRSGADATGTNSTSMLCSANSPSCCATYIGSVSMIGRTAIFSVTVSCSPAGAQAGSSRRNSNVIMSVLFIELDLFLKCPLIMPQHRYEKEETPQ
jgi:hypothetical protein